MKRGAQGGRQKRLAGALLLAAALAGTGCYDFHLEGPEDPPPVTPPRLVSVTVEYRQPNLCSASSDCENDVQFAASWMPLGQSILLERAAAYTWRGTVHGVPVNFPPRDDPHAVAIYDPHLRDTETGGRTAARLKIGGEILTVWDSQGTRDERGLIYIDENGLGHNQR